MPRMTEAKREEKRNSPEGYNPNAGRPRVYTDNASRQRAYRLRKEQMECDALAAATSDAGRQADQLNDFVGQAVRDALIAAANRRNHYPASLRIEEMGTLEALRYAIACIENADRDAATHVRATNRSQQITFDLQDLGL